MAREGLSAFTCTCKEEVKLSCLFLILIFVFKECQFLVNTFLVAFLKFIEILPALFTCPFYVDGQL